MVSLIITWRSLSIWGLCARVTDISSSVLSFSTCKEATKFWEGNSGLGFRVVDLLVLFVRDKVK